MMLGEPMLHPQFDEVCKMFKEIFPNAKLIVATNCQYNIKEGPFKGQTGKIVQMNRNQIKLELLSLGVSILLKVA